MAAPISDTVMGARAAHRPKLKAKPKLRKATVARAPINDTVMTARHKPVRPAARKVDVIRLPSEPKPKRTAKGKLIIPLAGVAPAVLVRSTAKTRQPIARTATPEARRAPLTDAIVRNRPTPTRWGGKVSPRSKKSGSGLPSIGGIARVVAHSADAIAEDIAKHPLDAASKTAKSAAETAKGVAATAIGLPVAFAKDEANKLSNRVTGGHRKDDSGAQAISRIAKETAKNVEDKYGPSYRGEKGAREKLVKRVAKEGPLPTALDLATVVAPASSGIGKVAKLGERARPALKIEPLKAASKQKARPSVVGTVATIAHDAARKAAQKTAAARSRQRLRTRAPGIKPLHIDGRKPSILNTEPKPLSARRATVVTGEVAPLLERAGNRTLRRHVAEEHTRGKTAGAYRVQRHVSGKKDSLRAAFKDLAPDLHSAAITAAQLGIKDAAGARAVLPVRIAEIERARSAALARTGKQGQKDASAEARAAKVGDAGELPQLKAWLANPQVFDNPAVQAASDATRRRVVGAREGLSDTRAAASRSKLVGATLGVKTAAEHSAEAAATYAATKAGTRASLEAKRAEVIRLQKAVSTQRAVAREAIVGAGAGGRVRLGDTATLKAIGRNAAKQAKRGTLSRVAVTAEPLVRNEAGLRVAKRELQDARVRHAQISSAAPTRLKESPIEYEHRVSEAATARGLANPEYVPSKHEVAGLPGDRSSGAPANPLGKERSGTLYRLGREHKQLDVVERSLSQSLKRGAAKEAEGHILGRHGLAFESRQAAEDYARGLGLNLDDKLGRVDVAIHSPTGGEAPRGTVTPRTTPKGRPIKSADAGNYVKTNNVFLVPKAVKQELDALGVQAARPASALQKLAHYPQAALLALSPSWFQFQRVNDAIAAAAGGSLHHTVGLEKLRKSLDPDSREVLHTMAGGSISSELLTPFSAQKVGRLQRVLDDNRIYQKAFGGQNPATVLLRADQAITHGVRERQLLHNLSIVARKMDPDVAAVQRAFGPLGHAFKTADMQLATKLLRDPRYRAQLEDAAQRLYKIHGDWHNYTAREQQLKHYAAFYGFLRYATRMALFTLPVGHPYVGALVAQLGQMGQRDAKAIIGPDLPYGLSALYNSDGTIAADMTRANPLLGPLFSIDKPEQAIGLATPLASIVLNHLTGMPLALNDSAEGRVTQYTYRGDPNRHGAGFFSTDRARVGVDAMLGLLSPYREWKKYDGRQQSSDSLAWDRRYLESTTPGPQSRIDEKNAAAKKAAGTAGLKHDLLPLAYPGSSKNVGEQGARVTAAKQQAAADRQLQSVKREAALHGMGAVDRQIQILDEQLKQLDAADPMSQLDNQLKLLDAQMGN